MSKKHVITWRAEPHTVAKIDMLKAYLHAYVPILGRAKRSKPFLYVDGFAGPGEYTNSPTGSPVAALVAAKAAMAQLGPAWSAGAITCVFIEPDKARCEHLRGRVSAFEGNPKLVVKVIQKSFEDGVAQVRQEVPQPFASDDPLFVFIDPFGATGVPFAAVAGILASRCSEVLINLDADGIARIFCAEHNRNRDEQLTALFGDESWRSALMVGEPLPLLCRRVLDLYKAKLRSLPGVRYVFPFEMRGAKDIAHLCDDGFLDHATDISNKRMMPPAAPCYTMRVRYTDGDDRPEFYERLGWGLPLLALLARLDGLRGVLDGDAAKAIDLLLAPLSGHRKEWER